MLDLEDTRRIFDQDSYFIVEEIRERKRKDLPSLVFCGLLTTVIPNYISHRHTRPDLIYSLCF